MKKNLLIVFCLSFMCLACSTDGFQLSSVRTTIDETPGNIRFSWQIATDASNVMQTAYKIDVAETPGDLRFGRNLVWTSGKVESDQSLYVPYAGPALKSNTHYYWKVKVWTSDGRSAKAKADWQSPLLNASDWKAKWIGINDTLVIRERRTSLPARYLRTEFACDAKVKRATLYVCGLGSSVCYINGQQVGNDVFGPLPTWYDASMLYLTYDVSNLVQQGSNAIGVLLGNGRFASMREPGIKGFGVPRLLAQLEIETSDGNITVVSDENWKATDKGPIMENNEFDGEVYDANLDLGAWTNVAYDDSAWRAADLMDAPKGVLRAQTSPCIKEMDEVNPVSVVKVPGDRYIIDMGQNMVGYLRVSFNGEKGQPITMRFAERMLGEDSLYVDNLRSALARDIYTPSADGQFTWQPTFTYHGFRYVEIQGLKIAPTVDSVVGKVIYDDMPTIGQFETSNTLVNQIYKNAYWGIRSNYRGMPTDCPQRDERLGWLGDRATGAYGESFVLGNEALYDKWLLDIEESMNENNSISVVSPRYWTIYNDDVTWPSAYFYVADMLYHQFGNDHAIRARYPSMKRWIQHMVDTTMKDYIMQKDTYGDWCMPPESEELIHSKDPARITSAQVLSTTVFYDILLRMQRFAAMNNQPADAAAYADLAAQMKEAYNAAYFNREKAQYDNNTVTANLLSLQLGLVPEGYEDKVFQSIVEKTNTVCNGHVSVGVLGIQHLMRGLTQHGNLELAYKILTNETFPSWGYMINHGATTIWELWNGDTAMPSMNSGNHVMLLGDLIIWFYENLAGIKNDPASVGFKKIWMEPSFPSDLTHVTASYDCPYGKISSAWQRDGDKLVWNITIPANTTATIKLPARFGDMALTDAAGNAQPCESNEKGTTAQVGSGTYTLKTVE